MQEPNQNGVYAPEITTVLARRGRSYVQAEIALCQDGLFHFALSVQCSDRGSGGPITIQSEGFASAQAAEEGALQEAINRFSRIAPYEPDGIRRELTDLKRQLERRFEQPLLL